MGRAVATKGRTFSMPSVFCHLKLPRRALSELPGAAPAASSSAVAAVATADDSSNLTQPSTAAPAPGCAGPVAAASPSPPRPSPPEPGEFFGSGLQAAGVE
jgi:hypothetical protein